MSQAPAPALPTDAPAPRGPYAARRASPAFALVEVFCGNTNLSPHVDRDLDELDAGLFEGCGALALVDTRGGSARVVEFAGGAAEGARRAVAHDWGAPLGEEAAARVDEFFVRALATFAGAGLVALGFRGHGDGLSEFAYAGRGRGTLFVAGGRAGLCWVTPVPTLPSRYDPTPGPDDEGKGVIVDTIVGRAFTLGDLARLLRDARDAGARPPDVLFFDTCLNGAVEIYEELRPFARAFVASSHLMPASGLPYDALFARLREAPSPADAATWAAAAVGAFVDVYRDFQPGFSWALAAFHAFPEQAASPIALAFAPLAGALAAAAEAGWHEWPDDLAAGCPSYGRLGAPQVSVEQSVDLLDLGRFFRDHPRSPSALREAAGGLEQAFADSRIAGAELGRAADLAGRVGGLSIWVPSGKAWRKGLPASYKELAFNRTTGWADCLERSIAAAGGALAQTAEPTAEPNAAPAIAPPAGGGRATRAKPNAGRALVIGCDTFGLRGAVRDAARVAAALEARGFGVEPCWGPGATRDAIIAAFGALSDRVGPNEAAVVFYSGHGGLALNPRYWGGADAEPEFFQFVVPTDYEAPGAAPFRGILSYELSLLLARLTARTKNATVLLDCCHAAQMSRDPRLVPKALPEVAFDGLDDVLDRLPSGRSEFARVAALGNAHAVRFVACDVGETAYERTSGDEVGGLFTDALLQALAEASEADVTWLALIARVRELVGARSTAQRPLVEGPATRALFSLAEPDRAGALALTIEAGACHLEGGRFSGLTPGDQYAVMPPGSARDEAPRRRALARVVEVGAFRSRVELAPPDAPDDLDGAPAFPLRKASAPTLVRLELAPPLRDELTAALERSRLLTPAGADAPPGTLVVSDENGALHVRGPDGELFAPLPAKGTAPLLANLERVAAARALRATLGEAGVNRGELEVEIGLVEGGRARPRQPGALFLAGDPLYIHLRNAGERTLYAHVFDLGVTQKLSLVTAFAPLGVRLRPGDEHVLGRHHVTGVLSGLRLKAPADAPGPTPLLESIVVIASTSPHSLQALVTPEGTTRGEAPPSPLRMRLQAALTGDPQAQGSDPKAENTPHLGLEVPLRLGRWHLDEPAPADTAPPLDARPLAIRLTELTLHDDRDLLGADLRIDTLARAIGPDGHPRLEARTLIAPRGSPGTTLPLDNTPLFEGAARGPVELCLWASRHREGASPLAALLEHERRAFARPARAPAAEAAEAPDALALARAAYAVLTRALGPALGACHLALTAPADGSPPARSTKRASDVSFGLLVEGAGGGEVKNEKV
jgi:Caspase domain/Clostripain family